MIDRKFKECIVEILNYLELVEKNHFLEYPSVEHIFIEILRARAYMLESFGISKEVAIELIKLNIPDFLIMCSNLDSSIGKDGFPYTEVNSQDLDEEGQVPEDWDDFIITIKN